MRFILFLVLVGFVLMRSPLLRASDQNISAWTSFRNGGASTVTGTLPKQWGPNRLPGNANCQAMVNPLLSSITVAFTLRASLVP